MGQVSGQTKAMGGTTGTAGGLQIERRFTRAGEDPFASVEWSRRTSKISNPDGTVVFEMRDAEVPAAWSQVAADIMVSKYFRKAGVPQVDETGQALRDEAGKPVLGPERSAKQVIHRLAGCWRDWGERHGYFATAEDAQAFYDELCHMLVRQMAAPNSPQWFNTGLAWAYGITGPAQGHYYVDPETGEMRESDDAYTHPAPHACFIQGVEDTLVGDGGIMDLWVREARIFKYGSGTGTNFSAIRGEGEPLSGGGTSSGLMSFLKVGDRAAGAIKSGGTTRRAAKMVVLDLDHPDIEGFVSWKANEEKKVAALIAAGYPSDYNGEAYATVSGQNSNNSVRVPDSFITAVEADATWDLIRRTDGTVHRTVRARDLWDRIADAAWQCADPGVQFDTTINAWHTCPAAGRINASNPCSEYLFLDNTACNLASLNLLQFMDTETNAFDVDGFRHAARLWTIVLEISVLMAQFPSAEIARRSYDYRTLGLGYANIGSVLMRLGLPYDSDAARAYTGAVTALMTGESYAASAEMAAHLGPFPGFAANRDDMLRVIRNHRRAAHDAAPAEYEDLTILPMGINEAGAPADILAAARRAWDVALDGGERHGYRNAQTTLLAPTGTIGLLMDCDTTGVEPDFALVKFKKLAGGGYFKIANQSLDPALRNLGYSAAERKDILTYVLGTLSLDGAPHVNRHTLAERGFSAEDLDAVERALPGTFELGFAFNAWSLGEAALARVGIDMATASAPGFDLLAALGFSRKQIAEANEVICGTMTIEGAPHLRDEHLPVFDCANRCGTKGQRYISAMGHIGMMAAAQSFLSGAISKTLNMPHEATVADIEDAYLQSWKHGIKALALYRDGSKLSQPLSTKSDVSQDDEAEDPIVAEAAIQARIDEAVAVAVAKALAAVETAKPGDVPAAAPAIAPAATVAPVMPEVIPATRSMVATPVAASPAASGAHRHRLPSKRNGFTQDARVAGQKVYLRTGEYADGTLGEIFIDMHKEGAAFRSMINCFAIAISKGLQYGVPLEEFIDTFTFTRFEPQGMVSGHPNIKTATSIIDFVFRVLGLEYEGRTDLVHVQPEPAQTPDDVLSGTGSPAMTQSGPAAPASVGQGGLAGSSDPTGGGTSHGTAQADLGAGEPGMASGTGASVAMADAPHVSPPAPATAAMAPASVGSGNGTTNGNGNGNGHGHHEPLGSMPRLAGSTTANAVAEAPLASPMAGMVNQMDAHLSNMMGDAPFCDVCGHITVRNGACYKCLNCGNSLGCS